MTEKNDPEVQPDVIDEKSDTERRSRVITEEIGTSSAYSIDVIELPSGNALTLDEAYRISSSQKVKFIVLAGAAASGKTTLITTIYHLLLKGPITNLYFAGSETLVGFERRCHQARVSSGKTLSTTERTPRGISETLLHLKLYNKINQLSHDLLITDYSGENYSAVIGNIQLTKTEFSGIKRADCLVLLIDGDLISDKRQRHGAEQEAMQLLETFCDANIINKNAKVYVLISKYDIVKERVNKDASLKLFIKQTEIKFKNKFGSRLKNYNFSHIVAMPEDTSKFTLGVGLDKLLKSWIENAMEDYVLDIEQLPDKMSEFDLFEKRSSDSMAKI